jgi:hypothetical protein
MILKHKKILKFVSAMALILAVAGTSLLFDHGRMDGHEKIEKPVGQKNNNGQQEEVKAADFVAIVSFIHFDLMQELYLIFNLEFDIDLPESNSFLQEIFINRYFKNLFCYVISPNAP